MQNPIKATADLTIQGICCDLQMPAVVLYHHHLSLLLLLSALSSFSISVSSSKAYVNGIYRAWYTFCCILILLSISYFALPFSLCVINCDLVWCIKNENKSF